MKKYSILTWHVHGNYLFYLSHIPHIIYLPVDEKKQGDYMGMGKGFPWGENVVEVELKDIPKIELDCILFQRDEHYLSEQYKILSLKQLLLPKIFLEHNPPLKHPTDTKHIINDPKILTVHVTGYNNLMWDCGRTPTKVISHGVTVPADASYSGELETGLVIINNLKERGRCMGEDIFNYAGKRVHLDLVGMGSSEMGGLGEISHQELPYFMSKYRFVFSPSRYTSLGLSVCEAMMVGMPIIGLATTEIANRFKNTICGYIDTDIERLILYMKRLLNDLKQARRLSAGAKAYAKKYFNIDRFVNDWNNILEEVIENR